VRALTNGYLIFSVYQIHILPRTLTSQHLLLLAKQKQNKSLRHFCDGNNKRALLSLCYHLQASKPCRQSPVEKSLKLQRFRSPNSTQLLSDSDKEGLTVETENFSGSVSPVYVRLHLLIKISELLIAGKISFVILTLIL
jgi:hypothetical protein